MLFAAQKKQNDTWQIWEMKLKNMKTRQITSSVENCVDPAYLPDGRVVFSKINLDNSLKTGNSLRTCNLDGSDLKRITFNPHSYFSSTVLKDGRILTISRQLHSDLGDPSFMVLRPDGTKAELFYRGTDGSSLCSRGFETTSGKIVFIESGEGNQAEGNITSINYNRPLHSRVNLTSGIKGDFRSVFPLPTGKLLVSYRLAESDRYALYEFDPEKRVLGKSVYNNSNFDAFEAVVVEKHDRPKILPSEVDLGVKTGLLLCQDINFSGIQALGNISSFQKADRIEVLGIDSTLGVVPVEKDGSFYLKVIADTPFRIQTVDESGHVIQGTVRLDMVAA